MVWPILAGAGAGIAGMFLGGATKKEQSIVQHAPYETYAPTTSRSYSIQYPDYNIIMNSPLSSAGSKKEMSTQQELRPSISPVGGDVPAEGTNWVLIAGLAVTGLVVYGLVSGRKK